MHKLLPVITNRRSENDSTLGRPSSENANVSWVWSFHTVIRVMVNYIMALNFRLWCDFLNFIFLAQPYHGKFQSSVERPKNGRAWTIQLAICFVVLCIISLNVRPIAEILKELERWHRPSDLVLVYSGNFKVPWNAYNWPSVVLLNSDLFHHTMHCPTKIQANSWNL